MHCASEYELGLDIRTAAYIVSTTHTLWLVSHLHNPSVKIDQLLILR